VLRGKFLSINVYIKKKKREFSNKQPNDAPLASRKTRTNQTQTKRQKEIIKIRANINEIETKTNYTKNQ
jgi:hypothetical protein